MRFEALSEKTAVLPLCSPMALEGEDCKVGKTTADAIKFGVMQSVFYEVKGYIESFSEKNRENLIIFIGGDAEYFVNQIKNAIFAGRKVMYSGLNRILEYNAENESI
jgi:type III pantothenate kinase